MGWMGRLRQAADPSPQKCLCIQGDLKYEHHQQQSHLHCEYDGQLSLIYCRLM